MQKEFLGSFEKYNQMGFESVMRLGEINLRALERLTEQQLAAASDCLEGGFKQMELWSGAKDLQTAMTGQSRLAGELQEKFLGHARKTAEILAETRGEYTDWVQRGMKAATPKPAAAKKSSA